MISSSALLVPALILAGIILIAILVWHHRNDTFRFINQVVDNNSFILIIFVAIAALSVITFLTVGLWHILGN